MYIGSKDARGVSKIHEGPLIICAKFCLLGFHVGLKLMVVMFFWKKGGKALTHITFNDTFTEKQTCERVNKETSVLKITINDSQQVSKVHDQLTIVPFHS